MTQPISYRRGFDRFTLEPELGPVEFEMALDIEEQVRILCVSRDIVHSIYKVTNNVGPLLRTGASIRTEKAPTERQLGGDR